MGADSRRLDGDGAFAGEGLVGPAGADAGVEMGSWVDGGRQPVLGLVVGDVADQEVITWSGVEQVAVLTAEQAVVADVVARAGEDLVVTGAGDDHVVAARRGRLGLPLGQVDRRGGRSRSRR